MTIEQLRVALTDARNENHALRDKRGKARRKFRPVAVPAVSMPVDDLDAVLREAESMIDEAYAVSGRLPTLTSFGEYQYDAHVGARRLHLIETAKAIATDLVRERVGFATEGVHLDAYHSGEQYRVHAIVRPKHSVTLCGWRPNYDVKDDGARGRGCHKVSPFSQTYQIDSPAIYGGYNFNYFGHVTSIGAKTVAIKENHGDRGHRLTIARFASWNDSDQRFEHDQRNNWSD